MDWTSEKPRRPGIYWFLHHDDRLAEDISVVEVHLEAGGTGSVSRSGFPTESLDTYDGIWMGPFAASAPTAAGRPARPQSRPAPR